MKPLELETGLCHIPFPQSLDPFRKRKAGHSVSHTKDYIKMVLLLQKEKHSHIQVEAAFSNWRYAV